MPADTEWSRTVTDLYKAHFTQLAGEAERWVGQRTVAEDLVQEAFAQLFGAGPDTDNPVGWARTATERLASEWLRTGHRDFRSSSETCHLPSGENRAMLKIGDAAVRRVLELLTEEERRAVDLRRRGLSYAEIGVQLGVPEREVGILLWRTLRKAADHLDASRPPGS